MQTIRISAILLLSAICLSCERDLDISDFEDDFGNYQPELKVTGRLRQEKPHDSIVRIIRTEAITDADVFNGIDDDGDGEIDEYDETLPLIQDTTATVTVTNLDSGEKFEFQYVELVDRETVRYRNDFDGEGAAIVIPDGGYKPISSRFQVELYARYRIEIQSKMSEKTITGETTVYPPVEFIDIDTLSVFDGDRITLKSDDEKAIYWKSDFSVTSYIITVEVPERIRENRIESAFVASYLSSRERDLTETHGVSIGKENFYVGRRLNAGKTLKITVESLNPEYGRYIFLSLPLNDARRSNLRDQDGKPVMGAFGSTAAKTIYVSIEEPN
ncbi:MAG: hypothetical protein OXN17_04895 [Candidatus Poribacteria bacterium]|nr:hypothetical protein [Candidatus Poribacteria bacterium]